MTRDPWVLAGEWTFVEAAHQMLHHGFRHGLLVDGAGRLEGVVHDFRVFQHGAYTTDLSAWVEFPGAPRQVRELGAPISAVVEAATPVHDALDRMLEADEDLVVVVDTGRHPIGVMTEHDFLGLAAELLPDEVPPPAVRGTVHTTTASAAIRETMARMAEFRIRHLVVTEAERAIAVVSLPDLASAHRVGHTVRDALPGRALFAHRTAISLRQAAREMWVHKIGCIPVLDVAERPVQIITRRDVLSGLVTHLRSMASRGVEISTVGVKTHTV